MFWTPSKFQTLRSKEGEVSIKRKQKSPFVSPSNESFICLRFFSIGKCGKSSETHRWVGRTNENDSSCATKLQRICEQKIPGLSKQMKNSASLKLLHQIFSSLDHVLQVHGIAHFCVQAVPHVVCQNGVHRISWMVLVPPDMI